jgi:fructosamine-3-kinase
MSIWTPIAYHISQATGQSFDPVHHSSVGGGCINRGYLLTDGDRTFFLKLNSADQATMFEAEADGLRNLQATGTIRVPMPICFGVDLGTSYLVLEWLDLAKGRSTGWYALGQQLARLHQAPPPAQTFGWHRHNTIGSTLQINTRMLNWADFWTEHRIGYQVQLARRRGGNFPLGDRLVAAIPQLLADYAPQPSLVHGDLWSGNAAVTEAGEPVIFDPAVYYGDREVDLAMTELFGGFPADFYTGYQAVFPLDAGYDQRKILYNLYHVLNHYNLFGGGYEAQAQQMMQELVG